MAVSSAFSPWPFAKKKRLVLDDGAAERTAENVLDELALADGVHVAFPLIGVEARGAIEPETGAVQFVGAGLGDHGHLAAGVAARVGREVAGEHAELSEHVDWGAAG